METIISLLNYVPSYVWKGFGYTILILASFKALKYLYEWYIKPHSEPWVKWGNQTALLLGWPILVILIFTCASKLIFTGSCLTTGYKCQYALGVSDMAQQYLSNLVGGEADITVSPKKG